MVYVGRVDDEILPSKPKPLPADFYRQFEQAICVQESVGAGAEIDVHDISTVVANDECDIEASRIDDAQINLERDEPSTKSHDHIEEEIIDAAVSRIDEAQVKVDDKSTVSDSQNISAMPTDASRIDEAQVAVGEKSSVGDLPEPSAMPSDASRIDEAQIKLAELESQIEVVEPSTDVVTPVMSTVDLNESRIDTAQVPVKEDESSSSIALITDKSNVHVSRIDDALVMEKEKESLDLAEEPTASHSDVEVSRIDDANIQQRDTVLKETITETTANELQSPINVDEVNRLDTVSVINTFLGNGKQDLSSEGQINLDENESSQSRIDNATPGHTLKDEMTAQTQDGEDVSESRIDIVKLPPTEAAITITSPSPSKDALISDKFV